MLKSVSWFTIVLLMLFFALSCHALDLTTAEQAWLEEHPVIKAGSDPDFPPVEFFNKNGIFKGMSADYVKLVEKDLGIKFQIKEYSSWDMVLKKAKNGEIDLITARSISEARSKYLSGTLPYIVLPGAIITRKAVKRQLTLKSLANKRVAIVLGYVWQEYVEADYPDVNIIAVADTSSGLKLVADGTVYAMVAALPMALYYIEKHGLSNLCFAGETGYVTKLSFLIRKDLPLLKTIMDKALLNINPKKRKEIYKKWINLDPVPLYRTLQFKSALVLFILVLIALMLIVVWNKRLKTEVLKQTRKLEKDINKRKKIEGQLKDSESRFRDFVDDLPVGIFRVTPEMPGKFILVNSAFALMFGFYSKEEVKEKTVAEFYSDPDQRKNLVRKLVTNGTAKMDLSSKNKDGSLFWCRVNIKTIFDEHGKALFFDGVSQNITREKEAEAEAVKSETLFAAFMDYFPGGVFVKDRKLNLLYANRFMKEVIGAEESWIGKKPDEIYPEKTAQRFIAHDKKTFKKKYLSCDEAIAGKNGKTRSYRIDKFVIEIENSDPLLGGIALDVTEKRELEDSLRQAQKLEGIGQLAGGIAHDFNNILSSMMGYSQLLLMDLKENANASKKVKRILESVERAGNLVRQLLAFSRKEMVTPRIIEPGRLVQNLYKMLARLIGEHIEFTLDIKDNIENICIDPGQMEQILINLVVNARDAVNEVKNRENKPVITVSIANYVSDDSKEVYVLFKVADSGAGMDQDIKEKIFEPFFTTKEVGKGTGLGLATVYGIVKQNRGYVRVASEPGKGTSFGVYIPAVQETIKGNKQESNNEISVQKQGSGQSILVAEDDHFIMDLLCDALTKKGYRVISAMNGREALEKAQNESELDLLITDITMPEMDGTALALKIEELFPESRVIFMSGYPAAESANGYSLINPETFIHKPVSLTELFAMIDKLFG
ncbi:MAG: transporter substrate-binding domain-containing protein [Thermodesulfobacteriota bacterium]|nr:transporter substrate-binding domain-containing protein [Thermodesulfobacteriota bacterium]